jgi:hypothetical protein
MEIFVEESVLMGYPEQGELDFLVLESPFDVQYMGQTYYSK